MGIEPTSHGSSPRLNGFENRARHQPRNHFRNTHASRGSPERISGSPGRRQGGRHFLHPYSTFNPRNSTWGGGNWGFSNSIRSRNNSLTTRLRNHLRSEGMMYQGAWEVLQRVMASS